MMFFSRVFKFIKQYPAILYSLLLVVILPLVLYYNTFLAAESFQENIDRNLQTKALVIENVLSTFLADIFGTPELLQEKLEKISEENPEIKDLRVAKEKAGGKFEILASQNSYEIGVITKDPSFVLSFSQDQTIANLTSKEGERFWSVIRPLYDAKEDKKIGLVSMSLSLKQADEAITQAIFRSYIIVIVAIVLSLALIFQHTRLFGYVSLTKKLQELDKMKDNFIRMATHELQSPVINIRGYLEVLEEEISTSLTKTQEELFYRAKVSAKNLADLISDILDVSRIEQERLDLSLQVFTPAKVIAETVQELKLKAEQKSLELVLDLEEERRGRSWAIKANPKRLRQVLVNLLDNALQYTFKGEVVVKTQVDLQKKRYIIEVKDTGIGISAENQARLFERFYRVKTKETADIPGTGLGLWIAKQLTEKMGGRIFIESMRGTGTKFSVIFPLIKG